MYRFGYHGVDSNYAVIVQQLPNGRWIKWIHPEIEFFFVQGLKNSYQARKILFDSQQMAHEPRVNFFNRCSESMMSLCQQLTGFVGEFISFPVEWPAIRLRLNKDLGHKLIPAGVRGNCLVCYTTKKQTSSAMFACSVCKCRIHKECWDDLHSPTITRNVRHTKYLFDDDPYFMEVFVRDSLHKKKTVEPVLDLDSLEPDDLPPTCAIKPIPSEF